MTELPRKLTTTVAGVGGLLAVLNFTISDLSYFVAVGIILLSAISMSLQHHADHVRQKGTHPNGKVKTKDT